MPPREQIATYGSPVFFGDPGCLAEMQHARQDFGSSPSRDLKGYHLVFEVFDLKNIGSFSISLARLQSCQARGLL